MFDKKILLCGWDGYIGFPLLQRLLEDGYRDITLIDNESRRKNVKYVDSFSIIPIYQPEIRIKQLEEKYDIKLKVFYADIHEDIRFLNELFKENNFDTIINLAHIPSGPFSQININMGSYTLNNNIIGTNNLLWLIKENCPSAHYITIGSTGEYSHTTDVPIEEGYFTLPGSSEKSIYPRRTNSTYHVSKIANTYLTDTLCRMWKIKSTDIQQAVVFGSFTPEIEKNNLNTRLDIDSCFGTVCNKFMTQAIYSDELTVYGKGDHKRGFISLNDSIQALMIAIENDDISNFDSDFSPRVWNQLSFWMSMNELAELIKNISLKEFNKNVKISHIKNPRNEKTTEPLHYSYKTDILKSYGYNPSVNIKDEILYTMKKIYYYSDLYKPKALEKIWKNNVRF